MGKLLRIFFFLLCFGLDFEIVFLYYVSSSVCPGACYIDLASPEFTRISTCLRFLSVGIKEVHHYALLKSFLLYAYILKHFCF